MDSRYSVIEVKGFQQRHVKSFNSLAEAKKKLKYYRAATPECRYLLIDNKTGFSIG